MASDYIEQAIITDLKASTVVHAKIKDAIYWLQADQDAAMPYCTFRVISDPHTPMSFDASDTGQARVQFNVIADSRYTALAGADAVRDRMDKYNTTMDGMTIYSCNCTGVITVPIPEQDNYYMATFDAVLRYKDA